MMDKLGVMVASVLSLSVIAVGVYAWMSLGDVAMSAAGYIALGLGVVATVAVGVGLMALVFYSNRQGFDDRAGARPLDEEHQPR
jgi:hypothetical protein